jgi:hypothetical protein
MRHSVGFPSAGSICALLALPQMAVAQTVPAIPPAMTSPDKVEARFGTLDFKDAMPSKQTITNIYDNRDFTQAFAAFVWDVLRQRLRRPS